MKMPPSAARFLMSFTGKKTGEFFQYLWREFYGDEIVPLTEQEAREWMEEHSSVDLYEEIFGEVEE